MARALKALDLDPSSAANARALSREAGVGSDTAAKAIQSAKPTARTIPSSCARCHSATSTSSKRSSASMNAHGRMMLTGALSNIGAICSGP